jgi:hypothetical protein
MTKLVLRGTIKAFQYLASRSKEQNDKLFKKLFLVLCEDECIIEYVVTPGLDILIEAPQIDLDTSALAHVER